MAEIDTNSVDKNAENQNVDANSVGKNADKQKYMLFRSVRTPEFRLAKKYTHSRPSRLLCNGFRLLMVADL